MERSDDNGLSETQNDIIIGIEPDKPEDITDLEKLFNPPVPIKSANKIGRNDPCPCGSGKKYVTAKITASSQC